jgi:hypothetical protein
LQAGRLKLFAHIDHAAGGATLGKTLRPTEVFILDNPKGGTPLMVSQPTAGIALPLKALVWQDKTGQVWFGYKDPAWIADRHAASNCLVVPNLSKALAGMASVVTARDGDTLTRPSAHRDMYPTAHRGQTRMGFTVSKEACNQAGRRSRVAAQIAGGGVTSERNCGASF